MGSSSGLLAERRLGLAIGGLFALPIGLLSGFTGVGGGEYRAPVLLALLGRVRWTIAANLFIGLSVGLFNVIFRQAWTLPVEYLGLALLFVPSSLPGAYIGARITKRLSTSVLKGLLAGILIATGLRLILFEVRTGGSLSFDLPSIVLALVLGFALGIVSGLLGVAGGEYRIPALIFLFGV
ncbi:MAG: sulfite exporter TauE/SafE family protein, partial [Methanobacteriota archaeon]